MWVNHVYTFALIIYFSDFVVFYNFCYILLQYFVYSTQFVNFIQLAEVKNIWQY